VRKHRPGFTADGEVRSQRPASSRPRARCPALFAQSDVWIMPYDSTSAETLQGRRPAGGVRDAGRGQRVVGVQRVRRCQIGEYRSGARSGEPFIAASAEGHSGNAAMGADQRPRAARRGAGKTIAAARSTRGARHDDHDKRPAAMDGTLQPGDRALLKTDTHRLSAAGAGRAAFSARVRLAGARHARDQLARGRRGVWRIIPAFSVIPTTSACCCARCCSACSSPPWTLALGLPLAYWLSRITQRWAPLCWCWRRFPLWISARGAFVRMDCAAGPQRRAEPDVAGARVGRRFVPVDRHASPAW